MRTTLIAAAAVFLAAHILLLPPTLEDIDSINFALGVRDFDVARHQPHPPGYPVFIVAAKASTAVLRAIGVPSPEVRGLAVWSALSGTALIFLLFAFFRALGAGAFNGGRPARLHVPFTGKGERVALWATVVAVASPLFWFTALRPLSDSTGLAAAVAAQALLASVVFRGAGVRGLLAGAFVAGLAIGVRSQTFALTLPLLVLVLVLPGLGIRLADRIAAIGAASLGVLAWAVPLIVASGGLEAYATALGSQAGEDFSGVVMLWNARTARVALDAAIHTFLWPWGWPVLGALVISAALAGAIRVGWRAPRVLLVIAVAFVPYAVFHLLFHEVVTVRYALPLVVPVSYFAAAAAAGRLPWLLPVAAGLLAIATLAMTVRPAVIYGREGSPAFRLAEHLRQEIVTGAGAAAGMPVDAVGLHAVARRLFDWDPPPRPVLAAPHGREWLRLVEAWRADPRLSIAFVADPRRTDLALFDPHARQLRREYRWGFIEPPFVGGARPGNSDWYSMSAPGWMLDRGWALTPEVAGVTTRDGLGPHVRPSVAWIRRRAEPAELMLGGRHLGAASDPAAEITLTLAGRPLATWTVSPGFFLQRVALPAGALDGAGAYVPLEVTARPAEGGSAVPVALEQFDLQPQGVPMRAFGAGWQEPEFNASTGRPWRWMSDSATLWVRPIGRDVVLTLAGESPRRYFDRPPVVRVDVGGREVARFEPSADFSRQIVLPAGALAAAGGEVVVESDQFFVPAERDGSADRRRLALRMYQAVVE